MRLQPNVPRRCPAAEGAGDAVRGGRRTGRQPPRPSRRIRLMRSPTYPAWSSRRPPVRRSKIPWCFPASLWPSTAAPRRRPTQSERPPRSRKLTCLMRKARNPLPSTINRCRLNLPPRRPPGRRLQAQGPRRIDRLRRKRVRRRLPIRLTSGLPCRRRRPVPSFASGSSAGARGRGRPPRANRKRSRRPLTHVVPPLPSVGGALAAGRRARLLTVRRPALAKLPGSGLRDGLTDRPAPMLTVARSVGPRPTGGPVASPRDATCRRRRRPTSRVSCGTARK